MKKVRKQNTILIIIFIIIIITSLFLTYNEIKTKNNIKTNKETNKENYATIGLYIENKNITKENKQNEKWTLQK